MAFSGHIDFNPPQKGNSNQKDKKLVDKLVEKLKEEQKPSNVSEEQKIDELVQKTGRILLKISGIFPFDFFPDELTIDENKLNIVARGLLDENLYSIQIKDLGDVSVETIPFFASLKITDNRYKDQPIVLKYLDPKEAVKARNIIQGLILAQEKKIDLANIETEDLIKKVEELGKVKES